MSFEITCALCQPEQVTHRHSTDENFWIADCLTCGVPMVVLKDHSIDPSVELIREMTTALWNVGVKIGGNWALDLERRQIPDHWHAHLRRVE